MFDRIDYRALNSRQQENHNFQKMAAILADYGFNCLRLTDDWQGADFIACHIDGETFLKVQLKGRLEIHQKYQGKNIYIGFLSNGGCFLFPHDPIMRWILENRPNVADSRSWRENGRYTWRVLPDFAPSLLADYRFLS